MAKLSPKWKGLAKIVKKLGPVNYRVIISSDPTQIDTYHTQNVNIFHGKTNVRSGGGVCNSLNVT